MHVHGIQTTTVDAENLEIALEVCGQGTRNRSMTWNGLKEAGK